jgi:2-dehydro-3-deoxyphosphogluconate aldolase/(4S)-4-hydroxy-2-oxoglutarate aldolase
VSAWFKAGVACVGMGSQLIKKSIIEKGDYKELTETCRFVMDLVKRYKM